MKLVRSIADYDVNLWLRREGKTMQYFAFKPATGWLRLWIRPVNARDALPVMTTVSVFFVVDDYTGV